MDRYKIKNKLGEGTTSIVYNAYDKERKKSVALKVFRKGFESEFKKEKSIVDILKRNGKFSKLLLPDEIICNFNVLSFKINVSLSYYLERFEMKFKDFVRAFFDLIDSIVHLHSLGIIHRDIKSDNCYWDGENLYLGDFGSASYQSNNMTSYIVTRWYRAPELLLGKYYNNKIDIYSTALLCIEMLIGEPLLKGDSELDQYYKTKVMYINKDKNYYYNREYLSNILNNVNLDDKDNLLDLLTKMLEWDFNKRIPGNEILDNIFFKNTHYLLIRELD